MGSRFSVYVLVLLWSLTAQAKVTIKLGTLAPDGSSWHSLLKQMGEQWSQVSQGTVKLKVYAGGVAGNEGDMVRKLRVGQLHSAALSVIGLHDIETSPQAISTPGLISDQSEWDHVFSKMEPVFEKRFLEKGFVVLNWGDTGWVQMFSSKNISSLDDLQGLKMFAWAGDPSSSKALRLAGFQPVVVSSTDIMPSLQTGMIQGFATAPIMAFTARWYENAKYMINASWGHLPGATIVNKDIWNKIPADLQPKLLAVARKIGVQVNTEVARMQAEAIVQMKKNGLQVVDLNQADQAKWVKLAEKMWPAIRGGVCTVEDFDEVKRVRDEYRAAKGQKKQ
jgi:TRAP-type C4-dicarboxylate transport system substrate-binding protein